MVNSIINRIQNSVEAKLKDMNIELVDIEYRQENDEQILRLIIDSPGGVNLNTCACASREVKTIIDEADVYYDQMQVSSPGIDRILKNDHDFSRFKGEKILLRTRKSFAGLRKVTGVLKDFDREYMEIDTTDDVIKIPREAITIIRLYPDN